MKPDLPQREGPRIDGAPDRDRRSGADRRSGRAREAKADAGRIPEAERRKIADRRRTGKEEDEKGEKGEKGKGYATRPAAAEAGPAGKTLPPGQSRQAKHRKKPARTVPDTAAPGSIHWSPSALRQWPRERRDTLFLMLPVLLSAAPQLPFLPWWIGTTFLALFGWRLALVFSGRWLPRASVRWAALFACAAGVYAQYGSLFGQEPGTALLMLFLGVKLMEMQARRDLYVVICLCFFLLLTSFFHTQSLPAVLAVLLAVAALLMAMLTLQYADEEAGLGARLRLSAVLLGQAAPLALVAFLLFPRPAIPLWGIAGDTQRATTGLSDSMTIGNLRELGESQEIAFRVRFEDRVPARPSLYWRGPVFDHFDGTSWRSSAPPARSGRTAARVAWGDDPGQRYAYTVTLETAQQNWLFALDLPWSVDAGSERVTLRQPGLELEADRPVRQGMRYRVVSRTGYRIDAERPLREMQPWLALPDGYAPRTRALAARWRAELANDEGVPADAGERALIRRALARFRIEPYRYTLRPPPLGRQAVDEFLFETRAGFCEHYASAFVVLMRALGIPARVVTGYQGGEYQRTTHEGAEWLVRQADAHAWSEVWLHGQGWVRIDPTAAVDPARIERGRRLQADDAVGAFTGPLLAWIRPLSRGFDAIGHAWERWVVRYDRTRQSSLLGRLGIDTANPMKLAGLLALALGILLLGTAMLTLRPRLARTPLERAWDLFCARLARIGLERARHETPAQYLRRLEQALPADAAASARLIVTTYERLRYGGEESGRQAARRLRQQVRAFRPYGSRRTADAGPLTPDR